MIDAVNTNLVASGIKGVSGIADLGDLAIGENNVTQSSGASFEQILTQLSDAVSSNISHAEHTSMQHIAGKTVGMTEVINSIMAAERSLSTAIAIRDKMVQAYTEISRMQI